MLLFLLLDTYLDVIERMTYTGTRRKTIKKGLLVCRTAIFYQNVGYTVIHFGVLAGPRSLRHHLVRKRPLCYQLAE